MEYPTDLLSNVLAIDVVYNASSCHVLSIKRFVNLISVPVLVLSMCCGLLNRHWTGAGRGGGGGSMLPEGGMVPLLKGGMLPDMTSIWC